MSGLRDLTLHQRTPVRVSHRRADLVRDKTVHEMAAEVRDSLDEKAVREMAAEVRGS